MSVERIKLLSLIFGITFVVLGLVVVLNSGAATTEDSIAQSNEAGLIQIGEIENKEYSFSYPQLAEAAQSIRYPNAAYIKVHIAGLDLMPGDTITVSDPAGTQIYRYPGSASTGADDGGFWALSILGDSVVITMNSSAAGEPLFPPEYQGVYEKALAGAPVDELGVVIDKFARGYPSEEIKRIESQCGDEDRVDVVCYDSSHTTEYNKSQPVALLLIDGTGSCTAWRVSDQNRMFTNEHCVTNQSDVDDTEVWFNYQNKTCGSSDLATTKIVTGDDFLIDSWAYDFALFTINDFSSIAGFGYLDVDPRKPIIGEHIYIPQHGGGEPKQFGINSDMNSGGICRIDDDVREGLVPGSDTGYFCDTAGGSSGSPVLARSNHQVVALHHFGILGSTCDQINMNQGVRMDLIWPMVRLFFDIEGYPLYFPFVMMNDCSNVIVNGGFETNLAWDLPATEYTASYTTDLYYAGLRSMSTGILKNSHNRFSYSSARQLVTIEEGTQVTLKARLWRMSGELDATNIPLPAGWQRMSLAGGIFPEGLELDSGDVQYILILDKYANWIDTLLWQRKDAHEWTYKEFDLSDYAGETIYLHFGTYNDGYGGISSMHVDEVVLEVCNAQGD